MSFYLPSGFKVENAEQLIALYKTLLAQPINTEPELRSFLKNVSDLESAVSEDMAWRYIRMTCDTSNKAHNDAYEEFVTKIQPKIAPFDNEINKKIVESPVAASSMTSPEDAIYLRTLKSAVDIFRDENIELNAKLATLAQEYGSIQGGMSVNLEGKELTMQQAGNYLLKTDRNMRKTAWESITAERLKATNRLEDIMNEMVQLRHQVAINAGFANFRDYMFQAMCRFDYTVQDCLDFHKSVRDNVVPVVKKLTEQRKEQMGIDNLMPWDTSVHPQGLEPLKPFNGEKDLTDNTIKCFADLDSYFGQCIQTMQTEKLLDLESRKGKAPGGYNYPLAQTNMPFIFMNATGNMRDLETMVHEGGHAIHSFLMAPLALNAYKNTPSEVAELASMSMELLSMDGWKYFFNDPTELKRARQEQLQGIPGTLCWIAQVDSFQHWMYENPSHKAQQRAKKWLELGTEYGTGMVDYSQHMDALTYSWHRQLHIFEVPFYYIEYGFAQLGSLGVWNNYLKNGPQAIEQYKDALKLGYTRSIPQIYETAGAKFDFSANYINGLMKQIEKELGL
jgi:oligoendopeptidase F